MKYVKGLKITDNCQYKKGRKYISDFGEVFEFSHIGKNEHPFFKDEGQGYKIREDEYNCMFFLVTDFYEAIEVAPELPAEGLVVHKEVGSIIYRTGKELGYGFNKDGTFKNHNDNSYSKIWSFKYYPEEWRPATPEEELKFIELLKKECERRGLYEDTKIKAHADDNERSDNYGEFNTLYTARRVWNKNGCIFNDGKFAEPLEEEATTLEDKIKELIELGKSKGLEINVTFE